MIGSRIKIEVTSNGLGGKELPTSYPGKAEAPGRDFQVRYVFRQLFVKARLRGPVRVSDRYLGTF